MSSDAYYYKVSENMNTDKRGFAMSLLEDWRNEAYDREEDPNQLKKLWDNYFEKERDIYKILLTDPSNVVTGTVKELADRFGVELKIMVGFLDGINDSLVQANPIETPAGISTLSLCARLIRPLPLQRVQGVLISLPLPPQVGQAAVDCIVMPMKLCVVRT